MPDKMTDDRKAEIRDILTKRRYGLNWEQIHQFRNIARDLLQENERLEEILWATKTIDKEYPWTLIVFKNGKHEANWSYKEEEFKKLIDLHPKIKNPDTKAEEDV